MSNNLNIIYSTLDKDVKNVVDTNVGSMQVSVMLVPRWEFNPKKAKPIQLTYTDDITSFYLVDDLYLIGLSGSIDIRNETSHMDLFLGKLDDYYIVINVTEYIKQSNGEYKPLYRYEPYIFVGSYVLTLTPVDSANKVLRIGLEDYFTNVLKTHSFANLLKLYPQICEVENYKDFFKYIVDYVKDYMKINSNNQYEMKKDLLYTSDMLLSGGIFNGYDKDNDMNIIVKNSILKLKNDDTIYLAVVQMLVDACTTIKTPASFSGNNTVIGDLLIPFFFKEEYADRWGFYYELWGKKSGSDIGAITSLMKTSGTPNRGSQGDSPIILNSGQECPMLLRNMTMRDIYMPFHSAFALPNTACIYETINPKDGKEGNFVPLNGFYQNEISSLQYIPISIPSLKKFKKNMMFIDCNVGGGAGGSSVLVFYSWLYDYFHKVFLKSDNMKSQNNIREYRIPNLVPSFHIMQRKNNIPHAKSEDFSFANRFDEANCYAITTETEDSLHEALRFIGKNVAVFMLGNESYTFRIRGSLLRRPNEIIKFNVVGGKKDSQQTLSVLPSLGGSSYTFLYVKKVGHHFDGRNYWNDISTCKIAEIFEK